MNNKQVATFGGDLDAWARSNYPSEEILNDSTLVEEMKSQLEAHLSDVKAGMSLAKSLAVRGLDVDVAPTVAPRAFCACPVLPISCLLIKCKGICLLFACTGGTA